MTEESLLSVVARVRRAMPRNADVMLVCDVAERYSIAEQRAAWTQNLYRYYDQIGRLLYIGVSLNAVYRLGQHKQKEWFGQISRIEVEKYETRDGALEAERSAIRAERPLYNLQYNRPDDDVNAPVNKPKSNGFDKRAYQRDLMRKRRAAARPA